MAVSVQNLKSLALSRTDGKVLGSKIPHEAIEYQFDGVSKKFTLDDWTNCKANTNITNLKAAILANTLRAAPSQSAANVTQIARKWKCKGALAEDILKEFYFEGQPADWCNPDGTADFMAFALRGDAPLATDNEKTLFMLLASSAISAYWRQNTSEFLNVGTMTISRPKPDSVTVVEEELVTFNWEIVLKKMRETAQESLLSTAPPIYADACNTTLDTMVYDVALAVGAGGFKKLVDNDIFVRGHSGVGYDFKYTKTTHLGPKDAKKADSTGFGKQLIAAFNHFRFIMYTEWRLGYELISHGGPLFA